MDSFRSSTIGQKLLIRSIAIAIVPLLILATVVFIGLNRLSNNSAEQIETSRNVLESESVQGNAEEQAQTLANEINNALAERISDVQAWARTEQVIDGARDGGLFSTNEGLRLLSDDELEAQFDRTKSTGAAGAAQNYFVQERKGNPLFTEIFMTDRNGYNIALTNLTSDFVQSDEGWWQLAWDQGISVENVEFDESSGTSSVAVAVRVDDIGGGQLGVIKATLDVSFIQELIASRGDIANYSVLLSDGSVVTDSANDASRYLNPAAELTEGEQLAVDSLTPGGAISDGFVYGYTRTARDLDDRINTSFNWIVVSEQSAEVALAPLDGLEQLSDDIESSGNTLRTTVILVLLAAVALAALMARYMSRSITGPLKKLTDAASRSAESGLPKAVAKINEDGAEIDSIKADEVEIKTGDELEDLADSFNSVQSRAIELAATQAKNRRNTTEMFVNLGRRNQSLLKRQLRFIDELEQDEADPDTLESLFRLDHLATRMRRNAESLLVLAGDRSPRRWSAPVPVRDGVQAALAEVEGYERVEISGVTEGSIQGNVVADVAHILAEIVENALNFSPPESEVVVAGKKTDSGYRVTITDEGLGMSAPDVEAANERLRTVHELNEVPSQYLGLFVVGRLADRHNIRVELAPGKTGLIATVDLPKSVTEAEPVETDDPAVGSTDAQDTEVASAEAEAKVLLAQAEEAMAKVEAAKEKLGNDVRADAEPSNAEAKSRRSEDAVDEDDASAKANARRAEDRKDDKAPKRPKAESKKAESKKAPTKPESTSDKSKAADSSETESKATEEVDVSGFTFTRRESKSSDETTEASPGRRSDDDAPDLESFGFTRRESKPSDKKSDAAETSSAPAAERSEEETMVDAEGSRNRWSRFQRGKEDAESETTESEAAQP